MKIVLAKRLCGLLLILSVIYLLLFSGLGSPCSAIILLIYSIGAIVTGVALVVGEKPWRWAWISVLISLSVVALFALALLLTLISRG